MFANLVVVQISAKSQHYGESRDTAELSGTRLISESLICFVGPKWPEPIQKEAEFFLPTLFGAFRTRENLRGIILAIMETFHRFSEPTVLPQLLERQNTSLIPELLHILTQTFEERKDTQTASSVLHFLASICGTKKLAEEMALNVRTLQHLLYLLQGFGLVICNHHFAEFILSPELAPYNEKGEEHSWFSVWCLVLNMVTLMLHSLGDSPLFDQFRTQVRAYKKDLFNTCRH
jgi:hypothetical protein